VESNKPDYPIYSSSTLVEA